jgi:hypothetical protein
MTRHFFTPRRRASVFGAGVFVGAFVAASGVLGADVPAPAPPNAPPTTCPSLSGPKDDAYVYFDAAGAGVLQAPPRNVVLPNQALTVDVCSTTNQAVAVAWAGSPGLTISAQTNVQIQPSLRVGVPLTSPPSVRVSRTRFEPRQAGQANLTVSVTNTSTNTTTQMPIELVVDGLYWGSVRLGLGTLFDVGNSWRSYSLATFAGSEQPEIRGDRDALGFEIVSAFAPYLLDVLFCPGGGRSYTGGCDWRIAPYLGFGMLGAGTAQGNLQALTSFDAGLEFEFANSFSIALAFALRRTKALDAGYSIGSPVTPGMTIDDVTHDQWLPGAEVVVNASPAFLQFATGSGSSGNGSGSGGSESGFGVGSSSGSSMSDGGTSPGTPGGSNDGGQSNDGSSHD